MFQGAFEFIQRENIRFTALLEILMCFPALSPLLYRILRQVEESTLTTRDFYCLVHFTFS